MPDSFRVHVAGNCRPPSPQPPHRGSIHRCDDKTIRCQKPERTHSACILRGDLDRWKVATMPQCYVGNGAGPAIQNRQPAQSRGAHAAVKICTSYLNDALYVRKGQIAYSQFRVRGRSAVPCLVPGRNGRFPGQDRTGTRRARERGGRLPPPGAGPRSGGLQPLRSAGRAHRSRRLVARPLGSPRTAALLGRYPG